MYYQSDKLRLTMSQFMSEHPNDVALGSLLEQIASVSRPVVRTERVDGQRVIEGYTTSYMNDKTGLGFTAIAHGPEGNARIRIFVEMVGKLPDAVDFGRRIAAALELEKSPA